MSTPAGLPWRVMTTSCVSASRRKRDKSSLTSERGTSFILDFRAAPAMTRPPIWGRSPVPPRSNPKGAAASGRSPLVDVPSMEGLGLGFVANHFDVVPVRTNDESCIVVRVVLRAQTRRTIVFATRLQSRAIESFDLLAILGRERQVKMRRLLLGLVQTQ